MERLVDYLTLKFETTADIIDQCMKTSSSMLKISKRDVAESVYDMVSIPREICHRSEQGKRPTNEDAHISKMLTIQGQKVFMAGVFDGHGGAQVSRNLAKDFPYFLEDRMNEIGISKTSLVDIIIEYDELLRGKVDAGSTLTMVLITKEQILVANLGDSRTMILDMQGNVLIVTKDHKPSTPSERKRIEEAGGFVSFVQGAQRTNGNLSLSRAMGDFDEKPLGQPYSISNRADIYQLERNQPVHIFLACDGFWDVVSTKGVSELTRTPEKACDMAVNLALQLKSTDNITTLLIEA